MASRGVEIKYGNIAPEAKENFMPVTNAAAEFSKLSDLQKYNLSFPNLGNPCELYSVGLDGGTQVFPSALVSENIGLWSESVSGEDGVFTAPIVLELTADELYSSQGLTLTFDTDNEIFATKINIKWYGEDGLLSDIDFYPAESIFLCENSVNEYNRLVITFYSLNMPYNRLKLRAIDYGFGTVFNGGNLRDIKLIQELNPISTEISINTADFTVEVGSEASFQTKQPLSIYFNGKLKATTFVKTAKRKSRDLWTITSEDYVGLMENVPFVGGIYTRRNALDLLTDIFNTAKVPFELQESFNSATVTGYIPYTNCRNALMQVAFAIGAAVDTSESNVVKIFRLNEEIIQTIPLNRIMQGQNFNEDETVTGVELTAHTYIPDAEDITTVYEADESGVGENIYIVFSEPLHSLQIINGDIVWQGTNYAVINANEGCVLSGARYRHVTQVKRKNHSSAIAGITEKVVSIQNATLVSSANIDNLLDKCYNWVRKTKRVNLKIVEGKHKTGGDIITYGSVKYGDAVFGQITPEVITYDAEVLVGDIIRAETEYAGVVSGMVVRESFNLNGGIIIKEAEMI